MLSTAHRVLDGDEHANNAGMYKMAHKNHPSTIWVRANSENYDWLQQHMEALMTEYTYRYGKHHATERLIYSLWEHPKNITNGDFTDPPMCMPDHCKDEDTVSAYHKYYIMEKSNFATWKRRDKPEWFNEERKFA